MPITVVPHPVTLSWSDFTPVRALSNHEDAHIDPGYEVQNRPLRRVGSQYMLAETLEVRVHPQARVLRTANQTADLIAHEQGHYDIGILAGRALAVDLAGLSADTPAKLKELADQAFTLHRLTRLGPIQHAYDDDTKHSQDPQEQQRWLQLIAAAMASGSATSINNLPL
jgi:hypothetical protein